MPGGFAGLDHRRLLIIFKETTMAKCEICGKSIQVGNNVSHSNKKSKTVWRPNVKRIKVLEDNRPTRKYVCTRRIRSGKVQKAI